MKTFRPRISVQKLRDLFQQENTNILSVTGLVVAFHAEEFAQEARARFRLLNPKTWFVSDANLKEEVTKSASPQEKHPKALFTSTPNYLVETDFAEAEIRALGYLTSPQKIPAR